MISYFNLRKGVQFLLDGQPYEVLDFKQTGKAQDMFVAKTRIKNLISGKIIEKSFHHGDVLEETEIEKMPIKFLYGHRDKYFFCEADNPSKRFFLEKEKIGKNADFLKQNQVLEGIIFNKEIINIVLPIKVQLKITEAPPGVRGERAQSGTKIVTLESGAKVNVPLFLKEGDIIEVNTETGEYSQRIIS